MLATLLIIFIIYVLYYFTSVSRFDKTGHPKKKGITDHDALPSEAKYFVEKYKVDKEKVNYKKMLKQIALLLGIDIAILSLAVLLIFKESVVLQIIVAVILIIPLYLFSLKFVGNYFKKKGLVKDEQNK